MISDNETDGRMASSKRMKTQRFNDNGQKRSIHQLLSSSIQVLQLHTFLHTNRSTQRYHYWWLLRPFLQATIPDYRTYHASLYVDWAIHSKDLRIQMYYCILQESLFTSSLLVQLHIILKNLQSSERTAVNYTGPVQNGVEHLLVEGLQKNWHASKGGTDPSVNQARGLEFLQVENLKFKF